MKTIKNKIMNDIELLNHLTGLLLREQKVTIDTVEIKMKVYYRDSYDYVDDKFLKDLMETTEREFYIEVGYNSLTYIFARTD